MAELCTWGLCGDTTELLAFWMLPYELNLKAVILDENISAIRHLMKHTPIFSVGFTESEEYGGTVGPHRPL